MPNHVLRDKSNRLPGGNQSARHQFSTLSSRELRVEKKQEGRMHKRMVFVSLTLTALSLADGEIQQDDLVNGLFFFTGDADGTGVARLSENEFFADVVASMYKGSAPQVIDQLTTAVSAARLEGRLIWMNDGQPKDGYLELNKLLTANFLNPIVVPHGDTVYTFDHAAQLIRAANPGIEVLW